jgi:DNA gyrase subunit A
VTSRLEHEQQQLARRIHILEGFEKVFDALDEIIRIIRKSDGKADAAEKIMKRFALDAEQTDAILELKLYRLARLEIQVIQNELAEKRKRARQIATLLKDESGRWTMVRDEIAEIQKKYGEPRRTKIEETEEVEYSADAFIIDEDNIVIVSRDGWVKRQKEVKDLSTTRLREGDAVLAAVAGSTRSTVVFFTNFGVAYTTRLVDVPASTGYGEPIQKIFKFKDGERVIAAMSLDARAIGEIVPRPASVRRAEASASAEPPIPPVHAVAVTSDGYSLRFSLEPFQEASTRAGRRYARAAEGAEVIMVAQTTGRETIIAATGDAHAMLCKVDEVNFLSGPGRGVILIKVKFPDDKVIGAMVSSGDRDLMTMETSRGAEQTISTAKYDVTGRGGKGRELLQRGQFVRMLPGEVSAPVLEGNDQR